MTNESISLAGVEETLRQVTGAGWELGSLDVDLDEFCLDLEDVRRHPQSYSLEPEEFGEGYDIEDYLDPVGEIYASHSFFKDGTHTGEFIAIHVELLPGGAVKRCFVSESGRRAWLDVGREVPTPEQALRMFRIKYPKKQAA